MRKQLRLIIEHTEHRRIQAKPPSELKNRQLAVESPVCGPNQAVADWTQQAPDFCIDVSHAPRGMHNQAYCRVWSQLFRQLVGVNEQASGWLLFQRRTNGSELRMCLGWMQHAIEGEQ